MYHGTGKAYLLGEVHSVLQGSSHAMARKRQCRGTSGSSRTRLTTAGATAWRAAGESPILSDEDSVRSPQHRHGGVLHREAIQCSLPSRRAGSEDKPLVLEQ